VFSVEVNDHKIYILLCMYKWIYCRMWISLLLWG